MPIFLRWVVFLFLLISMLAIYMDLCRTVIEVESMLEILDKSRKLSGITALSKCDGEWKLRGLFGVYKLKDAVNGMDTTDKVIMGRFRSDENTYLAIITDTETNESKLTIKTDMRNWIRSRGMLVVLLTGLVYLYYIV